MDVWRGKLVLEHRAGGYYRTAGTLVFASRTGVTVSVGPGLLTDGASVPGAFRWYLDPFAGDHIKAAVVHDFLYQSQVLPREDADALFREALVSLGMRESKAWTVWKAVSLGGGAAWNGKTENDIKHARACGHVERVGS